MASAVTTMAVVMILVAARVASVAVMVVVVTLYRDLFGIAMDPLQKGHHEPSDLLLMVVTILFVG